MKPAVEQRRITAALLVCMLAVSAVLSFAFLVKGADHECTGDDCPVCECIRLPGRTMRTQTAPESSPSAPAAVYVLQKAFICTKDCRIPADTLLEQRIRLNL